MFWHKFWELWESCECGQVANDTTWDMAEMAPSRWLSCWYFMGL
jgi:hypothetical protein